MKYYIIAGEASGDLHASNLMKAIKRGDADADFRCWGGDLMENEGGDIVKHYKDLAFMGFWEVATHLRTILNNLALCKVDILLYQPDVVILVDYPGFNLRIAQFAKENHFKVIYYISPQIWAWKKKRIKNIIRDVDEMMVILPFEKDFYQNYNVPVHFVGHPLLDAIDSNIKKKETVLNFRENNHLDNREIIAILPGSRRQEIIKIFPIMLKVIKHFPHYQFVISGVNWLPASLYHHFLKDNNIPILYNQTYELILNAKAAIVTSGTATLETALLGIPQVVCYKSSTLSFFIAKQLVKNIKYISLVNLIMDKAVVKELIQNDLTEKKLTNELSKITEDTNSIMQILHDYQEMYKVLGESHASDNAAQIVINAIT